MKNTLTLILLIVSAFINAQDRSLKLVSVKTTLLEKGVESKFFDLQQEAKKYYNAKFTLDKNNKSIVIANAINKTTILFGNLETVSHITDDQLSHLYPTDFIDECQGKNCGISKTFLNMLGKNDISNISYSFGKSSTEKDKTYVLYFIDRGVFALLINEDFILLNLRLNECKP